MSYCLTLHCRYQEETSFTDPLGPDSVPSPQVSQGEQGPSARSVRRPVSSLRRQARLDTEDPGQPLAPGNTLGKYQVSSL